MLEPPHACPQPEIPDQRLALPIEQGVLLWGMRMCVLGMKRGLDVAPPVHEMLEALGAPSAVPHLEAFMAALSSACTRMIEIRCTCQRQIGADEWAVLDVLSLAQALRPFEAVLLLRGMVSQAGAIAALREAEAVATALAEVGLFLPEPEQEIRHFALTQPAQPLPGPETLH